MPRFYTCTTALILGALASGAAAAESGSGFQLRATVPEVCEVHVAAALVATDAGTASTEVFEMCNSRRGFQIVASHRALEADEKVQINYGGQVNELDESGLSSLAVRQGPSLRNVPVVVQSASLAKVLVISLGMVAI